MSNFQLYEYYNVEDDAGFYAYGLYWLAQSFWGYKSFKIKSVKLKLYRVGNPSGVLTVSIRNAAGNDLCSVSKNCSEIALSPAQWYEFVFADNPYLPPCISYTIVIRAPDGDSSNYISWRVDSTSSTYDRGARRYSSDGGVSWGGTSTDTMFEVWGLPDLIAVIAYPIQKVDGVWSSYLLPVWAKDSSGGMHGVCHDGYDIIHCWSSDGGLTWDTELVYTETRDLSGVILNVIKPQIVIDSDDTLYVIWSVTATPYNYSKMSKKVVGGSWSVPIYVVPGTFEDDMSSTNVAYLMIDSSNHIHYVYWKQGYPDIDNYQICYRYYDGTSWSDFEIVLDNQTITNLTRIISVIDGSNNIHIFLSYTNKRIYEIIGSWGNWGSPTIIYDTGHSQYPLHVARINGIIYLSWRETLGTNNYKISFISNSGSGWGSPVLIGDAMYSLTYATFSLNGNIFRFNISLGQKISTDSKYSCFYFEYNGSSSTSILLALVVSYITGGEIVYTTQGNFIPFHTSYGQYFGKIISNKFLKSNMGFFKYF